MELTAVNQRPIVLGWLPFEKWFTLSHIKLPAELGARLYTKL